MLEYCGGGGGGSGRGGARGETLRTAFQGLPSVRHTIVVTGHWVLKVTAVSWQTRRLTGCGGPPVFRKGG